MALPRRSREAIRQAQTLSRHTVEDLMAVREAKGRGASPHHSTVETIASRDERILALANEAVASAPRGKREQVYREVTKGDVAIRELAWSLFP